MTRTLLVASAGGHLDELRIQADLLGIDVGDAVWVTSRTPHTESLLAGEQVAWRRPVGSGARLRGALELPGALALNKRVRPDLVVSTGAAFAVSHLAAARLAGTETWYVESATRVDEPSATGRFAASFTRARLFVQGPGWADPRWVPVPTVFDAYEVSDHASPPAGRLRAVVSLGSEHWPFRRAVERVLAVLPDAEIVWQTGATEVDLGGRRLPQWVPAVELRAAIRDADVVITHAGIGSALAALEEGKVPVFLPRRSDRGEHVDDHQTEAAARLGARGLAVAVDPDELTIEHVVRAASLGARRVSHSV